MFVDESGFHLLPTVARTYAPCGCTPVIYEGNPHDHLSVIGGLTPCGQFYVRLYQKALRGPQVAEFLRHLLRQIPSKVMVIWDGAPIHRSQEVKDLLRTPAGQRLWLEALPTAAPELNPTEGAWKLLKNELKNLACLNLSDLRHELYLAVRRIRARPDLLISCFAQARLKV